MILLTGCCARGGLGYAPASKGDNNIRANIQNMSGGKIYMKSSNLVEKSISKDLSVVYSCSELLGDVVREEVVYRYKD